MIWTDSGWKASTTGNLFRLYAVKRNLFVPHKNTTTESIRDCVDLNTLNDSFWVFPRGEDFSVTKISLATEELFTYKKA